MRDYDPIDRVPNRSTMDPPLHRDEQMVERESAMTTIGIFLAVAAVIGAGVYFWNASDSGQLVASNTPPAVTAPATPDPATTDSK